MQCRLNRLTEPKSRVVLKRNGEIALVDEKDRELDKYKVPYGATIEVADGQQCKGRTGLVLVGPAQNTYSGGSGRQDCLCRHY